MSHICPDCGLEHGDAQVAVAEVEPVAEASVRIAEIEADRDVTIARLGAKTEREVSESDLRTQVAEMQGVLAGLVTQLTPTQPEPEPESEPIPIVVDEPEPEPVMPEPVAAAPPIVDEAPKGRKKSNPWW